MGTSMISPSDWLSWRLVKMRLGKKSCQINNGTWNIIIEVGKIISEWLICRFHVKSSRVYKLFFRRWTEVLHDASCIQNAEYHPVEPSVIKKLRNNMFNQLPISIPIARINCGMRKGDSEKHALKGLYYPQNAHLSHIYKISAYWIHIRI